MYVSVKLQHQHIHFVLIRPYVFVCSWADLQHLDKGYGQQDGQKHNLQTMDQTQ